VLFGLKKPLGEHRRGGCGHEDCFAGSFEREVRTHFSEAEREFIGEELERLDVMRLEVVIDGCTPAADQRHRRARDDGGGAAERATAPLSDRGNEWPEHVPPLELRAEILEGPFTPSAARMGLGSVTHLTPAESESFFHGLDGIEPSRSTSDLLPGMPHQKEENAPLRMGEGIAGAGRNGNQGRRDGSIAGRCDGADERQAAGGPA